MITLLKEIVFSMFSHKILQAIITTKIVCLPVVLKYNGSHKQNCIFKCRQELRIITSPFYYASFSFLLQRHPESV